jgi:hypothetical protein
MELKKEGRSINNSEELSQYIKEITEKGNTQSTIIFEIYQELIKQDKDLLNFLDAEADDILLRLKKMEEYRRALATMKIKPIIEEPVGLKQGRKALIIGNSNYDRLPELAVGDKNSKDMYRLAESLGYLSEGW